MHDDLPLFEGFDPPTVPEPEPAVSADRRRTLRQAEQIAGGIHPLTGRRVHLLSDLHPEARDAKTLPYRCGSCYFRTVTKYHNRTYAKCAFPENLGADQVEKLGYPRVSHSAATDVRAWWPACPDYSPSDSLSDDAARYIPSEVDA